MFGNKKDKQLSGAELAEEGLRQIAIAIDNGLIKLEQGRIYDDVYVHADRPAGNPRLAYVMFNPLVRNQVIARCVVIFNNVEDGIPVWQVDWAVLKEYRRKGYGRSLATKAIIEFSNGMKGKMKDGFFLEAIVDEGNEASIRIATDLIGNEEIIYNEHTGKNVHNFLRRIDA